TSFSDVDFSGTTVSLNGSGITFGGNVTVTQGTLNGTGSFTMNGNLACNGAATAVTFATPSTATFGGNTTISTDQAAKTFTFFNATLNGNVILGTGITFTLTGAGALGLTTGTFSLNGGKLNVGTGAITT